MNKNYEPFIVEILGPLGLTAYLISADIAAKRLSDFKFRPTGVNLQNRRSHVIALVLFKFQRTTVCENERPINRKNILLELSLSLLKEIHKYQYLNCTRAIIRLGVVQNG